MSTESNDMLVASARVDFLVSEIEKIIESEKVTPVNILLVCLTSMQLVEKFPNMKGSEKKDLVIKAIETVIGKTNSDASLTGILPSFIDNMISVEKGKITISVDPEETISCCLQFLSSKKA